MPLATPSPNRRDEQFISTRWTLVLAAGDSQLPSQAALGALSDLCRNYWRPLYLFLRRNGLGPEDAQDLTQSFFAELIRNRAFRRADREKGRFRSFLLGALKHFVADWRAGLQAQKRGGGQTHELFDEQSIAELEAQMPGAENFSATALYDREWAAALLRQTLARLSQECVLTGRATLFEALHSYLAGTSDETIPYETLARKLQRHPVTLRSDVARFRSRYRAILREEVRGTVAESAEVDDELRYLCEVLARS